MEQKKIKQEGERPQLFIKKGKSIVVIYPTHTRGRGGRGRDPTWGGRGVVCPRVCVELLLYYIFNLFLFVPVLQRIYYYNL